MLYKKKNILLLLKYPQSWEEQYVRVLSHQFDVETIYANNLLYQGGSKYLISIINNKILETKCSIIFIEVDYYPAIDASFIASIKNIKKVMFSFDDLMFHERNALTAAAGMCDVVLTADPLSVLKYEEKLINAHLVLPESTVPDYDANEKIEKRNDVLFFGLTTKGDRAIFIDYLKSNGINVKVVGDKERISQARLLEEIKASKIILNLSKSSHTTTNLEFGYIEKDSFSLFLQFKLRVIEAGLNGVACVSEYTPAQNLMFSAEELPVFQTKEECLKIIKELLDNKNLLLDLANNLTKTVIEKYESKPLMAAVAKKIDNSFYRDVSVTIPDWYYLETLNERIRITHYKNPIKGPIKELISFHYPAKYWYSRQNIYICFIGSIVFIKQSYVFYKNRTVLKIKNILVRIKAKLYGSKKSYRKDNN